MPSPFKSRRKEARAPSPAASADMVSFACHEFGNSLSILTLGLGYMRASERGAVPADRRAGYEIIERTLRHLKSISRTFLETDRLSSGAFKAEPRALLLRPAANATVAMMEPEIFAKGLSISTDFPPNPVPVRMDPDVLSIVLANLLGNAIKYTPKGGRITVVIAQSRRKAARLSVEDTGIGITDENLAKILAGEFHRSERAKKHADGFGAGLTLIRRLLSASGMELNISSRRDKGTRCWFDIPLTADPPTA